MALLQFDTDVFLGVRFESYDCHNFTTERRDLVFSTSGQIGAVAEPSHTLSRLRADTTYTANFRTQYYLTMAPGTGGTVSPASGWKNSGAAVSIKGHARCGYSFTNWTGSGTGSYSGTTNPASITMGGPITETATFTHH